MEKVLFKSGDGCVFKECFIGSKECRLCTQFIGIDYENKWIKCSPYSSIQENKHLKKENNMLKNICNEFNSKVKIQQNKIKYLENKLKKGHV